MLPVCSRRTTFHERQTEACPALILIGLQRLIIARRPPPVHGVHGLSSALSQNHSHRAAYFTGYTQTHTGILENAAAITRGHARANNGMVVLPRFHSRFEAIKRRLDFVIVEHFVPRPNVRRLVPLASIIPTCHMNAGTCTPPARTVRSTAPERPW